MGKRGLCGVKIVARSTALKGFQDLVARCISNSTRTLPDHHTGEFTDWHNEYTDKLQYLERLAVRPASTIHYEQ